MIIIERNDRESIERLLKRYKRKYRKLKLRNELRRRKEFTKQSEKRRDEILNAKYRLQEYGIS